MTEFDVLSYLSPSERKSDDEIVQKVEAFEENVQISQEDVEETESVDESDEDGIVYTLDLPNIRSNPPAEILETLLKLMKLDPPKNFGHSQVNKTDLELLKSRAVSPKEFDHVTAWFEERGSAITRSKLIHLSSNISSPNDYLTSIVSSELLWIKDDNLKERIWKNASLRLSEHCGRTAQPDFVREISLSDGTLINLKEPSMTSDNLGLKTWGSSLMLSERLSKDPSLLKEPILELGAGTGLVGITCLKLGFKDTLLTDLPEIVPNMIKNIGLNNLEGELEVLDWSDCTSFQLSHPSAKFDTIILSDPVYSMQHPVWIVDMLKKFLSTEGKVLLQIPIRAHFVKERELLWNLLLENFIELQSISEDGYDDFGEQKFVFKVFKFNHSSSI